MSNFSIKVKIQGWREFINSRQKTKTSYHEEKQYLKFSKIQLFDFILKPILRGET